MALKRGDVCQHFADNNGFIKCLLYYTGDYIGKSFVQEIEVIALELPTAQRANPTDAQIQAVADPKAIAIYNGWKASIDAETASGLSKTAHPGQIATVVA